MLAFITRASESYWYELKEVNTIEDLFTIYDNLIVETNDYKSWTKEDFSEFWEGFKEEDAPLVSKAECHITIYDSYVE